MRLILMSTLRIINATMTTRIMSVELNQTDKIIGTNYDMWRRKMEFLLTEHDLSTYLTTAMVAPIEGADTQAQYRRDLETFEAWTKKDRRTRYIILNSMHDDLIGEFENFPTAMAMWEQLKFTFNDTSITKLRSLVLKFEMHRKDPKVSMTEHLRGMSSMVRDLNVLGHILTDEQQVQAIIRSLPDSWLHMKQILTHNDNIKILKDISRHVELEADRIVANQTAQAPLTKANPCKTIGFKLKKGDNGAPKQGKNSGGGSKSTPKKNAKHLKGKKRGTNKVKCFNCQKKGHFARDCTKLKKVTNSLTFINILVCSHVLVAHSLPDWIVDTEATKHVA